MTKPKAKKLFSSSLGRELEEYLMEKGYPKFRGAQLANWYFKRLEARDFQAMDNLPKALREALQEDFHFLSCTPEEELAAQDGSKKNTLLFLDGLRTETVTMDMDGHHTICLSTMVGCPVMCRFCRSGQAGLVRNLNSGEMLDCLRWSWPGNSKESPNLVIMGMGEPFYNYENLSRFLAFCRAREGFGIGSRHITVSTVGVLKGINSFARDFPQMNLAISLHASNEDIRRRLIPQAPSDIKSLIKAARSYCENTGRIVTMEYVLIKGVNDSPGCAMELAALLRRLPCKINLIPYNAVPGGPFETSPIESRRRFQDMLVENGLTATMRRSKGRMVQGACGQLAHERNREE